MIIAILTILSELLLGFKIVSLFRINIKFVERFLYALISGFMAGNWIIFLLNLIFGLNTYSILLAIFLMLFISKDVNRTFLDATLNLWGSIRANITKKKLKENIFVFIFFISLFIFFSFISYTHMLEEKSDGLYSAGYTWADLPFHTGIIVSFAENSNRGLEYLIYSGTPLHYHFMVDFSTTILIVGGFSLRFALIFINTIFLFSAFLLFYLLAHRIVKNQSVALFSVILFMFMGGLGFLYFLEDTQKQGLSVARDYTAYPEKGIHFGNPLTDALFPQRGYLIGLPALFIVLSVLWRNFTEKVNKKGLFFIGLIIGMLPLFHLYAFFSSVFVAIFLVVCFCRTKKKIIEVLPFFGIIAVLSLPQMLWYFSKVNTNFVRIYLGWLAQAQQQNWLQFWVFNLGIILLLSLPAFIVANRNLKKFSLPFICLFLIGNIFALQPNTHYNITLFYIWGIVNSILVASLFYKIFNKGYLYKVIVIFLVFFSTFSGFLSLLWETQSSWKEFDKDEVELSDWVKENTPKDSIFLTSTAHNHFVHALSGRRILMGYRGSLWSHAIDYSQREKDVASMFAGNTESVELLIKYGVDYVVIGPSERSEFSANGSFFADNFQLAKDSQNYKIYKV